MTGNNSTFASKGGQRSLLFLDQNAKPEDIEAGVFSPSDRLLSDHDNLRLAGDSLDRTQRMALEAEQIGASVLGDLRRQREQIQRTSRHLHDADQDLDQSNRILREMLRQINANKALTTAIIILLTVAISIVLYYKIFY